MSRRLSGLSKRELVAFIFSYCQLPEFHQFHCITEQMLKGAGIDDLDKARWAIINDNCANSKLLRRLAGQAVSSQGSSPVVQSAMPTDRQAIINEIWRFCQRKRFDKYLNPDMLRAQADSDLRTALTAIRHGSFPRLINGLLSTQPNLPL